MGEQVVPSPTTRKIKMREGYILFWKLEGKSKISAGTLFANKTLWCYCYCCCCCHYACKAKMPSNGLVITGTVYILKNRETALKIFVLFLLRHVGVEVSQCLRCFFEPRAFPTWVSWQSPLPRVIPWLKCPYLMKRWMCPWCLLVVCWLWSIISLSGMCTWGWLWSWARCPFSSVLLSFGFSAKSHLHKMRPSQPTGREAPVAQRAEKIILSIVTS